MTCVSELCSKNTLSTAVYDLLVPLIAKLPDTASSLSTSPNPTLTSNHPPTSQPSGTATTSKTVPRQPSPNPSPSHTTGQPQCNRELVEEKNQLKGVEVCTHLPSSHTYLDYLWKKVHDIVHAHTYYAIVHTLHNTICTRYIHINYCSYI